MNSTPVVPISRLVGSHCLKEMDEACPSREPSDKRGDTHALEVKSSDNKGHTASGVRRSHSSDNVTEAGCAKETSDKETSDKEKSDKERSGKETSGKETSCKERSGKEARETRERSETWPASARSKTIEELFHREPGEAEPANAILDAMKRAGLKKARYAVRRQDDELSDAEKQRVAESEMRALMKEGQVKPDEPALLQSLLKWHLSDVSQKRRIFRDFFAQWTKKDLLHLQRQYNQFKLNNDRHQAYEGTHTFDARARQWVDILVTHPYSVLLLQEAIESRDQPQEVDKEVLWSMLSLEYKKCLGEQ